MSAWTVASWNVNSIRARLPNVLEWLEKENPDVLALQETKVVDGAFPAAEFNALGYELVFSGQPAYNGVAILSKNPFTDVIKDFPNFQDDSRRVLAATIGSVRVVNVYIPNGQSVDSEKYQYKLQWLQAFVTFAEEERKKHSQVILLGDFNIAPEDQDVHDPEAWKGSVLVSEPEREAFRTLLAKGYYDSYRHLHPEDKEYSWWDYRMMAFRRNRGLRIDHVLLTEPLLKICQSSRIDKEPRKKEKASDHTPVMVTLEI